jgi:prepilin-type N-terminal cleavage/methylation domain-containing protein
MIARRARKKVLAFSLQPSAFACAGFTMVEIAISLAIIGIALVAILGVLPIGLRMQRDNREQTVINHDATIFMEAIRGGARGLDDLTNYVYAITNYWTRFDGNGVFNSSGINGYSYGGASITAPSIANYFSAPINSGASIISLLTTPEYVDLNGGPLNNRSFDNGGFSNHVVAYVRSISGPAVEKPPQANDSIVRGDSFTYRILCVNGPVEVSATPWVPGQYGAGSIVGFGYGFRQATATTRVQPDTPGSTDWVRVPYLDQLTANLRELRLTFLWPQLPNGGLGLGRQTFRTMVAGQLVMTTNNNQALYFYQSQSFTNAP